MIAPKVCPQLPDALLGNTNRPGSHLQLVRRNDAPQAALDCANADDDIRSAVINF